MPVLNPPSDPSKILVEVPLPQPVASQPRQPAPQPVQQQPPQPEPEPDPFRQIKGPPVMILPHVAIKGKEKMERKGKPIKFSERDFFAVTRALARNPYDDAGHAALADMLTEINHPLGQLIESRLMPGEDEDSPGHQSYWDWRSASNPEVAHTDEEESLDNGFLARRLGRSDTPLGRIEFFHVPRGGVPHDQKHVIHVVFPSSRGHGYTFEMGEKEASDFADSMAASEHGAEVGNSLKSRLADRPWIPQGGQNNDVYRMSRFRSPAGGMVVRGMYYPGGKMLPKEATESNPKPNTKAKGKKKKRKKAPVDTFLPEVEPYEMKAKKKKKMSRKGKPTKFAETDLTIPKVLDKFTVKDQEKLLDKIHSTGGFSLDLNPDHPLAKKFVPYEHNFLFLPDKREGRSGAYVRLTPIDPLNDPHGEKGVKAVTMSKLSPSEIDGYIGGWNARADERREYVGVPPNKPIVASLLFKHPFHALGYTDADNHRPVGHSLHADLSGDNRADQEHIFLGPNSSFGSEVYQLGGGLFQNDLWKRYVGTAGIHSTKIGGSGSSVLRKAILPLWHEYLKTHPNAHRGDLQVLSERFHKLADRLAVRQEWLDSIISKAHPYYTKARDGQIIRRLAKDVDVDRMQDDHADAIREAVKAAGFKVVEDKKPEKMRRLKFSEGDYRKYNPLAGKADPADKKAFEEKFDSAPRPKKRDKLVELLHPFWGEHHLGDITAFHDSLPANHASREDVKRMMADADPGAAQRLIDRHGNNAPGESYHLVSRAKREGFNPSLGNSTSWYQDRLGKRDEPPEEFPISFRRGKPAKFNLRGDPDFDAFVEHTRSDESTPESRQVFSDFLEENGHPFKHILRDGDSDKTVYSNQHHKTSWGLPDSGFRQGIFTFYGPDHYFTVLPTETNKFGVEGVIGYKYDDEDNGTDEEKGQLVSKRNPMDHDSVIDLIDDAIDYNNKHINDNDLSEEIRDSMKRSNSRAAAFKDWYMPKQKKMSRKGKPAKLSESEGKLIPHHSLTSIEADLGYKGKYNNIGYFLKDLHDELPDNHPVKPVVREAIETGNLGPIREIDGWWNSLHPENNLRSYLEDHRDNNRQSSGYSRQMRGDLLGELEPLIKKKRLESGQPLRDNDYVSPEYDKDDDDSDPPPNDFSISFKRKKRIKFARLDHEPFAKTIAESRLTTGDQTPSLVFADFLEENGNPAHRVVRKHVDGDYEHPYSGQYPMGAAIPPYSEILNDRRSLITINSPDDGRGHHVEFIPDTGDDTKPGIPDDTAQNDVWTNGRVPHFARMDNAELYEFLRDLHHYDPKRLTKQEYLETLGRHGIADYEDADLHPTGRKMKRKGKPTKMGREAEQAVDHLAPIVQQDPNNEAARGILADALEETGLHHDPETLDHLRNTQYPVYGMVHPASGKWVFSPRRSWLIEQFARANSNQEGWEAEFNLEQNNHQQFSDFLHSIGLHGHAEAFDSHQDVNDRSGYWIEDNPSWQKTNRTNHLGNVALIDSTPNGRITIYRDRDSGGELASRIAMEQAAIAEEDHLHG